MDFGLLSKGRRSRRTDFLSDARCMYVIFYNNWPSLFYETLCKQLTCLMGGKMKIKITVDFTNVFSGVCLS
jgi:hypothetical protein